MMRRAAVGLGVMAVCAGAATMPGGQGAATVQPIVSAMNRMPKNLWPVADEAATQATARNDWVVKNFPKSSLIYTGILYATSEMRSRLPASLPTRVTVHLKLDKSDLWGGKGSMSITATIKNVNPQLAIKWEDGMRMSIAGIADVIPHSDPSPLNIDVEIKEAVISSSPVKVATVAEPTGQSFKSLADLLGSIPENLWPSSDESTLSKQAREAWITKHIMGRKFGPWEFAGSIKDVRQESGIVIELVSQNLIAEGQTKQSVWIVQLAGVSADEAMGWKAGMKVKGTGVIFIQDPGWLLGNPQPMAVEVRVQQAKLIVTP